MYNVHIFNNIKTKADGKYYLFEYLCIFENNLRIFVVLVSVKKENLEKSIAKMHLIRFENRRKLLFPAIVCALAIFTASSFPQPDFIDLSIHLQDKIVHFCAYFVLGASLQFGFFRNFEVRGKRQILILACVVASLYGASDELHQYFVPGRSCDILDWVADTLGASFSLFFSKYIDNFSFRFLEHLNSKAK